MMTNGREDMFKADGLEERLKRAATVTLPKRFYKQAHVGEEAGAFVPRLDGKPIRTPGKARLALPNQPLADAVAAEWDAQTDVIDPGRMPLTRLVNTIIDAVSAKRPAVIDEIVAYAGSDMVCYRAEAPERLAEQQREAWDPILAWAETHLQASFVLTAGVMPVAQPQGSLDSVRRAAEALDNFALGAVASMTNLTGSAILALAVNDALLDAQQAWTAAHVDEDYQIAQWGEDAEARARRDRRWSEMEAATRLLELMRS